MPQSKKNSRDGKPPSLLREVSWFFKVLYENLFELVQLNFLWILSCLPLVTIPAACTAACRISLRMLQQEDYRLGKEFWKEFRRSFWRSLQTGGPLLLRGVPCGIGAISSYPMLAQAAHYGWFLLSCAGLALVCGMAVHLFPLMAAVELPASALLKNAFLLYFFCLPRTLFALFLVIALNLAAVCLLPYAFPLLLLLLFSVEGLLAAAAALPGISLCKQPE